MFKHQSRLYIILGCIIALLSVSYVGYRAYQNHIESSAQAFNRSVEGQHDRSSYDHTHHGEGSPAASIPNQIGETEHQHEHHETLDGEYRYEINGVPLYTKRALSQEQIELHEWIATGKMSPAVKDLFNSRSEYVRNNVRQRIIAPDGNLYMVSVPRDWQYEEGDQILQSELISQDFFAEEEPWRGAVMNIQGVEYPFPEEYYSIEDPYERDEYSNKFAYSIKNKVSMVEIEKKVAKGELDFSLSEEAKRYADASKTKRERARRLTPNLPPVSDLPPVKVSFLPDDEARRPGWMQKQELNAWQSILAGEEEGSREIFDGGNINEDASGSPVRSDVPTSPSDLSDMVKPTPSPSSVADIEKQLTPQGIEGVSPDRFDKAQQLIDEYGTEEGLRRLREMDPETARQFERERRGAPSREVPSGDTHPDGQSHDDSP